MGLCGFHKLVTNLYYSLIYRSTEFLGGFCLFVLFFIFSSFSLFVQIGLFEVLFFMDCVLMYQSRSESSGNLC